MRKSRVVAVGTVLGLAFTAGTLVGVAPSIGESDAPAECEVVSSTEVLRYGKKWQSGSPERPGPTYAMARRVIATTTLCGDSYSTAIHWGKPTPVVYAP